jgi:hypothetical protein
VAEGQPERRRFGKPKKRFYPWCTYRTARRVYSVEGKQKSVDRHQPLETAIGRALNEPYWNDEETS